MPVFLRVLQLQGAVASKTRRLLCVLFVRLGQVPADSAAGLLRVASAVPVRSHCPVRQPVHRGRSERASPGGHPGVEGSDAQERRGGPAAKAWGVLLASLQLGLTSFGGPIAHLGFFQREIIDNPVWLVL